MRVKAGIGIALVAFIMGAVVWLKIRRKKS